MESRIVAHDTPLTPHETVLVMQGGGSLGAYECGVYKTLKRHELEFDIVAGTSIGAINAAIITGNDPESSAKILEQFWLSLAERITPSFLEDNIRAIFSSFIVSLYGNKNMIEPVWFYPASLLNYYSIFSSYTRIPPHLYDVKPLEEKPIDITFTFILSCSYKVCRLSTRQTMN